MTRFQQLLACAALGVLTVSGCGTKSDGPPRFDVYGSVTANGQPVQEGRIFFSPDAAKGNAGPGAVAMIQNGKYQTPKGHGVVGGPHMVDILGYDALSNPDSDEESQVRIKQVIPVDLPQQGGNYDFNL